MVFDKSFVNIEVSSFASDSATGIIVGLYGGGCVYSSPVTDGEGDVTRGELISLFSSSVALNSGRSRFSFSVATLNLFPEN